MLVSAPKTPENEENGAAIRSRRWCRRRPQSGICLHSLVEGSCQLTVPGHGRGHAKHSPMSATRILVMRSAGRFKMQKYIRHSFQAEGLGIGALAVAADRGFHNPRDAWDPRGLRNQVLAVVSP